jgi:hypothetical protein
MQSTGTSSGHRVLWNDAAVVTFFAAALLLTVAVIALQLAGRGEVFDVEALLIFRRLFLFQDYPGSLLFILALILALLPQVQTAGFRLGAWLGTRPVVAAVLSCGVLSLGAVWVYGAHPLAMDEFAPYMQSQIFGEGALLGRFPAELLDWLVVPGFQDYFIHVSRETGEIASSYWPGFALLLTPFTAAGVPWLCNPMVAALSLIVLHRIALQLTGSSVAAGTAVLFSVASAAFVVNGISFYSMSAHLLCNAAFALLLFNPTPARATLAGLVGGLSLTLHNPVPHILFAVPWLVWLVSRQDRWRMVPAILIGYLPWVAFVGFGWRQVLGGLAGPQEVVGATTVVETAVQAIATFVSVFKAPSAVMLEVRLIGLAKLWLWAAPAMVLLAVAGAFRHWSDTRVRLLAGSALVTLIGYLFVPLDQGHGWGFRYFHSAWFVLPVLAAAAVVPSGRSGTSAAAVDRWTPLSRYTQGAAVAGLLVMVPFFAWQVRSFIDAHLAQLPRADQGQARVVIINPAMAYYAQDLVQNDPFLRQPVIFMITHGRKRDAEMIARHYPTLELLSQSYRGSVWGHKTSPGDSSRGAVPVPIDDQR